MSPSVWRTARCALVSTDLRLKCQCSHNSQKGDLKTRLMTPFSASSAQLQRQPDLLLPNAMIAILFFANGQHAQAKTTKHSQSMSAPKHFNLPSDWRITICMEQSISQSPHFLLSIKEEDSVQWGLYSPGCQMDSDGKPWHHEWRLCDQSARVWERERERLITGQFQVTYMTVGSHDTPEINSTRCSRWLESHIIGHLSLLILLWRGNSKKHTRCSLTCHHSITHLLCERTLSELLMWLEYRWPLVSPLHVQISVAVSTHGGDDETQCFFSFSTFT